MKEIMVIFAVLLTMLSQVQSQSVEIVYKKFLSMDSEKIAILGHDKLLKISKVADYYKLVYSNGKSKYSFSHFVSADGGFTKSNVMDIVVYKDHNDQQVYYIDELNDIHTGYKEKMTRSDEWNISTETKMIKEYTCYKATKKVEGNDVVAYFTYDISCPDGPALFSGLPGLILEVKKGSTMYQLVEYKVLDQGWDIDLPSESVIVSKAEFEKYKAQKFSNTGY